MVLRATVFISYCKFHICILSIFFEFQTYRTQYLADTSILTETAIRFYCRNSQEKSSTVPFKLIRRYTSIVSNRNLVNLRHLFLLIFCSSPSSKDYFMKIICRFTQTFERLVKIVQYFLSPIRV